MGESTTAIFGEFVGYSKTLDCRYILSIHDSRTRRELRLTPVAP